MAQRARDTVMYVKAYNQFLAKSGVYYIGADLKVMSPQLYVAR